MVMVVVAGVVVLVGLVVRVVIIVVVVVVVVVMVVVVTIVIVVICSCSCKGIAMFPLIILFCNYSEFVITLRRLAVDSYKQAVKRNVVEIVVVVLDLC